MKNFFLAVALFVSATAFAQVKQTITNSAVNYEIKNMGFNTKGTFSGLQAEIKFDDAHLSTSTINASIDAASVNSDNAMRDDHLKSNDYFDVTRYPRITMRSVSFKHKSGNNYTGVFNVTIKDKTKALDVPFTYVESGTTAIFKGVFKLNRQDFGVGGKSLVLANEATISISAETTK